MLVSYILVTLSSVFVCVCLFSRFEILPHIHKRTPDLPYLTCLKLYSQQTGTGGVMLWPRVLHTKERESLSHSVWHTPGTRAYCPAPGCTSQPGEGGLLLARWWKTLFKVTNWNLDCQHDFRLATELKCWVQREAGQSSEQTTTSLVKSCLCLNKTYKSVSVYHSSVPWAHFSNNSASQ